MMPEQLTKLRPDRDLQCYFHQPSAIAAISDASEDRLTISGCWRQQFDWAVLEWNRDNVFEHPAFRNLPDGDLRGLRLTYDETRINCVPLDSTIFDSIDWSYLRIWTESDSEEAFHRVLLRPLAVPVAGGYQPGIVEFELNGSVTAGDYIELAWLSWHHNYRLTAADTLESAIEALAADINAWTVSNRVEAHAQGRRIRLTYLGADGSNCNRVGVYATVAGARSAFWDQTSATFEGGTSPSTWRVSLDFANLTDIEGSHVDTRNVRKMRWTWAADLQMGEFERSEFAVQITNWQVSGVGRQYSLPGAGSRRIENQHPEVVYSGAWLEERGNYSSGSIRYTNVPSSFLKCTYSAAAVHRIYLGTRYIGDGGMIEIAVDSRQSVQVNLRRPAEDRLVRIPLGEFDPDVVHTVAVTHAGPSGARVYFDFLDVVVPSTELPEFLPSPVMTLATDWDTDHSLAVAPERTAWMIHSLGFRGRANHYAGALWFYDLRLDGHNYASATVEFNGIPQFGCTTELVLGGDSIRHLNLVGDTAESIAVCFELLINAGSSATWARADGATLTVVARALGEDGNGLPIACNTNSSVFVADLSGPNLSGGTRGKWLTDQDAEPRINRAARDWSRSYYRALDRYGIDVTAAFSTELGHGDDTLQAGIAQRYPGSPCWVNTPALQTNFGPQSQAFWKQVYLDMAQVMVEAEVTPYLQFGEVQWWYFADDGTGMPYYDEYTKSLFQSTFGRPMGLIPDQNTDPTSYMQECQFLAGLIGRFTDAIITFVRMRYENTRFEVLYPPDVNDTPLNRLVNFPFDYWNPSNLTCLKTENFTYTANRNLNKVRESITLPETLGFSRSKSSHLIGIGECTTPWDKERRFAIGEGIESVVLFALDQFCLINYRLPFPRSHRQVRFMGS